jgi:hypothetical protein
VSKTYRRQGRTGNSSNSSGTGGKGGGGQDGKGGGGQGGGGGGGQGGSGGGGGQGGGGGGGGQLVHVSGDLLGAPEQWIAHQCNCRSRGARGLAKHLFGRFPHANVYKVNAGIVVNDIFTVQQASYCCYCLVAGSVCKPGQL